MPNLPASVPVPSYASRPERADACLADLILRVASEAPEAGLYWSSSNPAQQVQFTSYGALLEEARGILGGLQSHLSGAGAKVVLLLDRPADFIPAFWACILGGYVPCPLAHIRSDPDRWSKHVSHVDALLEKPLFVSAGALASELPASVAFADLAALRTSGADDKFQRVSASELALLMLTSGSTGNSKAVELTHANLLASMAGRAERQQLTPHDRTFNWIAFDHVAALLESHMVALYVAATQLHAEPASILATPLRFLELIDRHRITLAFAPNFLLAQINAALESATRKPLTLDLSCLRRIVTGGEANVVETGRRFLGLLAPYGLARTALWPAFGMTETCAASVYSHEFPDCDANNEFAAVGSPIEGLELRIVDESGSSLPPGQSGELQLRGAVIFRRYHNNEQATRAAFTDDGWFRTGDVGRVDECRLNLIARSKDSIIVSGVNYFSHELETQLEQLAGIERSFVAAFPTRPKGADTEQLVVTCATTLPEEDEEGLYQLFVAIRNTTIMLWGFRPSSILLLHKSDFPKTSLGKIQRTMMRNRFEGGAYEAASQRRALITSRQLGQYETPEGPLEAALTEVFSQVLGTEVEILSASASFFDMGGTSIDILTLTHTLEQRFGFKAGLPVVLQNPTVRQLAARISSGQQREVDTYEPIVPLQSTGKKTPLFCVHPGNGEILVLVNGAKYFLNDRPFLAIRPRGFNPGEDCFTTADEVITCYVNAIRQRQPHGPYAIAGYSLGARISFEIAKRLEAQGERVAFLGCIDFFPSYEATAIDFNTIALGLAFVTDLINKEQRDALMASLSKDKAAEVNCKQILAMASADRLTELGLDLPRFVAWARVAHSIEDLFFRYVTTGSVSAMTVFCSNGVSYYDEYPREVWHRLLHGWDGFAGKVRYVDVPGVHHTLMSPKHVSAYQAILRSEIDLKLGE